MKLPIKIVISGLLGLATTAHAIDCEEGLDFHGNLKFSADYFGYPSEYLRDFDSDSDEPVIKKGESVFLSGWIEFTKISRKRCYYTVKDLKLSKEDGAIIYPHNYQPIKAWLTYKNGELDEFRIVNFEIHASYQITDDEGSREVVWEGPSLHISTQFNNWDDTQVVFDGTAINLEFDTTTHPKYANAEIRLYRD